MAEPESPPAPDPSATDSGALPPEPSSGPAGARATPARSGTAMAVVFGLWLMTLAGALAAAWVYVYVPVTERLSDAESTAAGLRADIETLTGANGALAGRLSGQEIALASVQQAIARVDARTAGFESAWRTAEAEHLLRIAAQAAHLRQDPAIARAALDAADNALAASAEPAWVPVRDAIAEARTALDAVVTVDRVGLRLELRARAEALGQAPLHGLPGGTAGPRTLPPAQSWWDRLVALVREVFVLRRVDGASALGPQGADLVRAELRVRFAQAEIAVDRGDTQALRGALEDITALLKGYYDPAAPATMAALETAARMARIDLEPALPDLSAPLDRLHQATARQAEPESSP